MNSCGANKVAVIHKSSVAVDTAENSGAAGAGDAARARGQALERAPREPRERHRFDEVRIEAQGHR